MQKTNKLKIQSFIVCFCLIVFNLFLCLFGGVTSFVSHGAYQERVKGYSRVLTDLQSDENFNVEDYPSIENDYSLQVIQVAETEGNEVLVYVYQPSAETLELIGTKISVSTTILNNYSPELYDLVLLNTDGVFQKYRIDGLSVKEDVVRYYEISEIFRAFNEDIDVPPTGNNTTSNVAYAVAQRWTACTLNDQVYYDCEKTEVVEITDMFVGFVEYPDGFRFMSGNWGESACQSHFVAFNSDHKMDELLEADITFTHQSRAYDLQDVITPVIGTAYTETKTLNHTDTTEYTTQGIFNHNKYSWKTIQTPSEFIESVESKQVYKAGVVNVIGKTTLVQEDKDIINNMQYVLRFYETDYLEETREVAISPVVTGSVVTTYIQETAVTDVAILRLKFVYEGKVYNLGVVGDMQSGSGLASSITEWTAEISEEFKILMKILGVFIIIVLICLVLQLLGWLKPVLDFLAKIFLAILKGLWWLICSPFKFIKSLIKKE